MRIETERLIIRDLERKDQEQLFKIVWQKMWCALCVIGQRIVLIQSLLMGMWNGISHRRILQMCMNVKDLPLRSKVKINAMDSTQICLEGLFINQTLFSLGVERITDILSLQRQQKLSVLWRD